MKKIIFSISLLFATSLAYTQIATSLSSKPDPTKKIYTLEASCGECNFGLEGNDCDLAVKFKGKAYYVDGIGIKEYGHPHNENGFCVAVRKAEVQGDVVDGRFKATYFKLLEPKKQKGK